MSIIWHPNGYTRTILSEAADGSREGVNLWTVAGYEDAHIHQHRAPFTSAIEEGVMREELYTWTADPDGDYELWTVDCYTDEEGNYHVDEHAPRVSCRIELKEILFHRAGENYDRPEWDFHKVIAEEVPLRTRVSSGAVTQRIHHQLRRKEKG